MLPSRYGRCKTLVDGLERGGLVRRSALENLDHRRSAVAWKGQLEGATNLNPVHMHYPSHAPHPQLDAFAQIRTELVRAIPEPT